MFRLELKAGGEALQDTLREVGIGGKSPADLTQMALRSVLFGESNPLTDPYGFCDANQ